MEPISSSEAAPLAADYQEILLQVARAAVEHGVEHGQALSVRAEEYPAVLRPLRASFVTLRVQGELRGCIGTCQAVRPLVEDVAHNAHAAAFADPRFPPMSGEELADLHIHISLLSLPEAMTFFSQEELLAQVRPGVDGLLLEDGFNKGTLLPSVWESLPDVESFVRHLKLKAGLPPDHWSSSLRVYRYTAESIE